MKRPALFTSEEKLSPMLVVDKEGFLGGKIAEELSKEILVVFVSGGNQKPSSHNLIHIPYSKKYPEIPDNKYSHIIVFDNNDRGVEESLTDFIKKSEKDDALLVYCAPLLLSTQKIAQKIVKAYTKSKSIIYGDIFLSENPQSIDNPVSRIISSAVSRKEIKIPGEGLMDTYPVLLNDFIDGFFTAVFGKNDEKKFFVFDKNPTTLISFSHILQKIEPEIKIDFIGKEKNETRNIEMTGNYLLSDYNLSEKVKLINFDSKQTEENGHKPKEKKRRINLKAKFLYIGTFILFVLLLPSISMAGFLGLGALQMKVLEESIASGNLLQAHESIERGSFFLGKAAISSNLVKLQAEPLGLKGKTDQVSDQIHQYQRLLDAAQGFVVSGNLIKDVTEGKTDNPSSSIAIATSSYKKAFNQLSQIRLEKKINQNVLKAIDGYYPVLQLVYSLSDVLSNILGVDGQKRYLVLFQNNMELRPGGGFVGSFGVASFDRGKFLDFKINDVYDADGQLKGHVEPPYPIRRYLKSEHWYLRDSNFNVDFTKSASSEAFFLREEMGVDVQGVIGVDVSFVREVIRSLGEVYVPEYNQKINAENFYAITQEHAEKDFFPSSTQKKDFLGSLFSAIQNDLGNKKLSYPILLESIYKGISEKHIVFAFKDRNVQDIFSALSYSSTLADFRRDTVNDFLGISEANLGVNKSNLFIGRSVKYDAILEDSGIISATASLSLKNTSDSPSGADYKAYIRFITPQGSSLSNISIDNLSQKIVSAVTDFTVYEKKGFIPPQGLEVEKYDQDGKTIFGFLINVPKGKLKEISLSYNLLKKIPLNRPSSIYSLKYFKQPGTENYPFSFSFSYPKSFSIVSTDPNTEKNESKITFSENLYTDKLIKIDLSKAQ